MELYGNLYGEAAAVPADMQAILKGTSLLETISWKNEEFFAIFDATCYNVLYFGGNIKDIFGYEKEDLDRSNISLFFKGLDKEHLSFPLAIARWGCRMIRHFSPDDLKAGFRCTFCGVSVRHKNGALIRLLANYIPLQYTENGTPSLVFVTVKNISYLLKSDFYWARMCCGPSLEYIATYHSQTKHSKFEDIISDREKEVLRLIIEGKSTKEIADLLFLSPNTVEKHRKNMLARTGAKDTTALSVLGLNSNMV